MTTHDPTTPAGVADVPPSSEPPPCVALGTAIRRLRWKRELTIEGLAHAADMHPTYLSGIERGRRNPTWTKIVSVAQALGVSVSCLVAVADQEGEIARVAAETRSRLERDVTHKSRVSV